MPNVLLGVHVERLTDAGAAKFARRSEELAWQVASKLPARHANGRPLGTDDC